MKQLFLKIFIVGLVIGGISFWLVYHKTKKEEAEACKFLASYSSNPEKIYEDCIRDQGSPSILGLPKNSPTQNTKVEQNCRPNYSGCLNPNASDYDCLNGSGNGPFYTGEVRVLGPDVFGLDRDGDGRGCE